MKLENAKYQNLLSKVGASTISYLATGYFEEEVVAGSKGLWFVDKYIFATDYQMDEFVELSTKHIESMRDYVPHPAAIELN